MGTSTPFAGPKNGNPLLPSWLSGADGQPDGAPPPADTVPAPTAPDAAPTERTTGRTPQATGMRTGTQLPAPPSRRRTPTSVPAGRS